MFRERVPEYRNRKRFIYLVHALLGIVAAVYLADAPHGQKDLEVFAKSLSQGQLKALGVRRDTKTGRCSSPDQTTFNRMMSSVNADMVEEVRIKWQRRIRGPAPSNEIVTKKRIESKLPDPGSFVPEEHAGCSAGHHREEKKRQWVKRQLVCAPATGEELLFPCVGQIARLQRHRTGRKPETVCLVTSRPASELSPEQWLEANIDHWGIETGLHARLDASRHDDRCRLRNAKPLRRHSMFTRVANSLCCEWLSRHPKPQHFTTTDFRGAMAADHDRTAIALVTSVRPRLPKPNPTRHSRA